MSPSTRAPAAAAAPFGLASRHGATAASSAAKTEQRMATAAISELETRSGQMVRVPQPNDIILGRGVPLAKYAGNVQFRNIIRLHKDAYNSTGRHHNKQNVASAVLAEIQRRQGRFLDKIETTNDNGTHSQAFYIVSEDVALTKIKQALREMGPATTKPGQSKRKRNIRQEVAPQAQVDAAAPIQAPRNESAPTAAMLSVNAAVAPLQVAPSLHSAQQHQQPWSAQPEYTGAAPNLTAESAHPSLVAAWLQSTAQHQYNQQQQMMLPYLMALHEQRTLQQQVAPPGFSAMRMMPPCQPSLQPSFQLPVAASTSIFPTGMGVNDLPLSSSANSANAPLLSILLAAQQQRERQLQAGQQMSRVAPAHTQQLEAAPPPHTSMYAAKSPAQPVPQHLFPSPPVLPHYQHQPTPQAQFQALVASQVAAAEASDASRQACLSLLRTAQGPMIAAASERPAASTVARSNAASVVADRGTERVAGAATRHGPDSSTAISTSIDGHHPTNAFGPLLVALAQKHPEAAFGPAMSDGSVQCNSVGAPIDAPTNAHHSQMGEVERNPSARQQSQCAPAANGSDWSSSSDSDSSSESLMQSSQRAPFYKKEAL